VPVVPVVAEERLRREQAQVLALGQAPLVQEQEPVPRQPLEQPELARRAGEAVPRLPRAELA